MSTLHADEPRCTQPAVSDAADLVIEGRARNVGTLVVARVLPAAQRRHVGPFVFLDHMGPVQLAPGVGFDIRPHPHIGLSTVTYFLSGENIHRDSLGTVQVNRPGDLNLMTAGRGVVHSERADAIWRSHGGLLHGIQMWLGLPVDHEEDPPSFEHHPRTTLPEVVPARGTVGRLLLGSAYGVRSPVRHPSQLLLVDLQLEAGACLDIAEDQPERGVYVISGEVALGATPLPPRSLGTLVAGRTGSVKAVAASRILLLGGQHLGPRFMDWNFVSSKRERIEQARQAWIDQSFPRIPGDAVEFEPLPRRANIGRPGGATS